MISLCITGLSDYAIAAVAGALQAAGVAPAQASHSATLISALQAGMPAFTKPQSDANEGAAAEAEVHTAGVARSGLSSAEKFTMKSLA